MSTFLPFQNLKSERLFLRRLTINDVPEIFTLRSNEKSMQFIPKPIMQNINEAITHFKIINENIDHNKDVNWAITLKTSNKLIGIIGHYSIKWEHFRSEIGYMILPEYENKGIATEAVGLCLNFGFSFMNLHSVEAIINSENSASAKVLEKNKFVKEAHFKENEFYNRKFYDTVIYSVLKTKWYDF